MKIYVVGSSKNQFLPLNNIRQKFIVDAPHEGENIDFLNPWYCELTGLYHLWKNCKDEIVGLEHYRRYFVNKKNQILSESEIRKLLDDNDIICIRANYSRRRPPKTWLIRNKKWADMQKFLAFIKVYVGEDYYNTCVSHLNGDWHALGNMFICRKELIDEYCEFMFDLTIQYIEAERFYGRKLPGRILGYFAEFLFGAWLKFHNKKIKFNKMRMVRFR